MRKRWLSYAGLRWRDFKSSLSSRFIYGDEQNKNPCDKYSYIDQDTWDKFVAAHKDFSGSTPPCEGLTMEAAQHMISAAISKGIAENTAELKQFLENKMAAKFQQLSAYLVQKNNLCIPEPSADLNSDEASSPNPLENIPMVGP